MDSARVANLTNVNQEVLRQMDDALRLVQWLPQQVSALQRIAQLIIEAVSRDNVVFLMGNGGSAADAQHLAGEFVNKLSNDRAPLPALALTGDPAVLTAIANDYGYQQIFARQIRALVRPGDIVVALSTSGESTNVILGVEEARKRGATTIAITGRSGRLGRIADVSLSVPSEETPRIQEATMIVGHIICYLVENYFMSRDQCQRPLAPVEKDG